MPVCQPSCQYTKLAINKWILKNLAQDKSCSFSQTWLNTTAFSQFLRNSTGCSRLFWAFSVWVCVGIHWGTGANQVLVTVDIINTAHSWPKFCVWTYKRLKWKKYSLIWFKSPIYLYLEVKRVKETEIMSHHNQASAYCQIWLTSHQMEYELKSRGVRDKLKNFFRESKC